jgi:hypothetical protein
VRACARPSGQAGPGAGARRLGPWELCARGRLSLARKRAGERRALEACGARCGSTLARAEQAASERRAGASERAARPGAGSRRAALEQGGAGERRRGSAQAQRQARCAGRARARQVQEPCGGEQPGACSGARSGPGARVEQRVRGGAERRRWATVARSCDRRWRAEADSCGACGTRARPRQAMARRRANAGMIRQGRSKRGTGNRRRAVQGDNVQGNGVQDNGVQRIAVFSLDELRPRPRWCAGRSHTVREELQCDGCGRIRTGTAGPRMEDVGSC